MTVRRTTSLKKAARIAAQMVEIVVLIWIGGGWAVAVMLAISGN
jgi:hypothetical protein